MDTRWMVMGVFLTGCMGSLGDVDDDGMTPGPAPDTWALSVDTEASDRYVPLEQASAAVRGSVEATAQPVTVQVGLPDAMSAVTPSGGGFSSNVSIDPGLSLVQVIATDAEGRSRDGHRSVLRSDAVPEGEILAGTAAMAVDDAMLATLASSAGAQISALDLSGFITPGAPLVSAAGCTIYADSLSHSPPTLALAVTDEGALRATAELRDITVNFHGQCSLLGRNITIRDSSQVDETTAQLSMNLTPIEPTAPDMCISGFTSSDVSLELTEFDIDLRLSGCGLLCLAGELIGEIAEGAIKGMLEDQIREQLDGVIDPQLAMLDLFGDPEPIEFLGAPVTVGLCMTGLGPEMGQLTARLGTSVTGAGGGAHTAPGAPILPATAELSTPGAVYLDPALVGQIVYSVWNSGALTFDDISALAPDVPNVPLSLLGQEVQAFARTQGIPATESLQVGIDAAMAPLVRAATPEEAAAGVDLWIEIGDLRLRLATSQGELMTVSTHVRLAMALEATPDGALAPVPVPSETEVVAWMSSTVVPELSNRSINSIVDTFQPILAEQIPNLLSGAAIQLPELGGPLLVADVAATPGGFLEVILAPPAAPMAPPGM